MVIINLNYCYQGIGIFPENGFPYSLLSLKGILLLSKLINSSKTYTYCSKDIKLFLGLK